MSTVTPNPANGQGLYDGTIAFRAHDDVCDNKVAGVYVHNASRFSATECEELCDLQRWHSSILQGNTAPLVSNPTGLSLNAGTLVYISGFDTASQMPYLAKADSADPARAAKYVLLDSMAIAGNGAVYDGGVVSGLDTSAATAAGDPVYAGTDGVYSFIAPATNPQIVGYVAVKDGSNGSIDFKIQQPLVGGVNIINATTTRVVTAGETGTIFTNAAAGGEVEFDLPTAQAGLQYTFIVAASANVKVKASAGDVISIGAFSSVAGGVSECADPFCKLHVIAIDSTNWVGAESGTWTLT